MKEVSPGLDHPVCGKQERYTALEVDQGVLQHEIYLHVTKGNLPVATGAFRRGGFLCCPWYSVPRCINNA